MADLFSTIEIITMDDNGHSNVYDGLGSVQHHNCYGRGDFAMVESCVAHKVCANRSSKIQLVAEHVHFIHYNFES